EALHGEGEVGQGAPVGERLTGEAEAAHPDGSGQAVEAVVEPGGGGHAEAGPAGLAHPADARAARGARVLRLLPGHARVRPRRQRTRQFAVAVVEEGEGEVVHVSGKGEREKGSKGEESRTDLPFSPSPAPPFTINPPRKWAAPC